MARHLANDIGAVAARRLSNGRFHIVASRVEEDVGAHLFGHLESVIQHLYRDHAGGACGAGDAYGEQPDRAATEDRDDPARDIRGQHGVKGVAERVEDSGVVERDAWRHRYDVCGRDSHIVGERSVAVDTY